MLEEVVHLLSSIQLTGDICDVEDVPPLLTIHHILSSPSSHRLHSTSPLTHSSISFLFIFLLIFSHSFARNKI